MLRLGVPDLLSCQGVLVGRLLPMDLGVPKNRQTKQSLLYLSNISILYVFRQSDRI